MSKKKSLTIDKILKTDDISDILDTVYKQRADICNMVIIIEAPDKDGEKILTCYNTNMSNLVFCGMLDWAKMEIFNQACEESEE